MDVFVSNCSLHRLRLQVVIWHVSAVVSESSAFAPVETTRTFSFFRQCLIVWVFRRRVAQPLPTEAHIQYIQYSGCSRTYKCSRVWARTLVVYDTNWKSPMGVWQSHYSSIMVCQIVVWQCLLLGVHGKPTRSSAIRRESAHLTWLYCTVQTAFQYETV